MLRSAQTAALKVVSEPGVGATERKARPAFQRRHVVGGWRCYSSLPAGRRLGGHDEVSGAVHSGLVVDLNVKKVQQSTGGVVKELLTRDGDRVPAGTCWSVSMRR